MEQGGYNATAIHTTSVGMFSSFEEIKPLFTFSKLVSSVTYEIGVQYSGTCAMFNMTLLEARVQYISIEVSIYTVSYIYLPFLTTSEFKSCTDHSLQKREIQANSTSFALVQLLATFPSTTTKSDVILSISSPYPLVLTHSYRLLPSLLPYLQI